MFMCVCVCMCISVFVYLYVYICVYVCLYIDIYIYVYVCMRVSVYSLNSALPRRRMVHRLTSRFAHRHVNKAVPVRSIYICDLHCVIP
ncbi:hypothetical protein EJ05DRAFT_39484 [Pseudovirgaria hyperparasitica]|uniref:Uncharacterized protein n=1 Tax=Pseudovirgaria hyperparasitica TaxID=470096 RepID=A0A6A6WN66_9PEZI|nr:uncharacterized protein EJ05DRAFT_39484 [Pseudovirgaria hyperparasitica]KAF2763462.1 hypothetical protein EJ05DRAFT_39484 [Pseudovirgaria hyperparasitica]